MEIYLFKFVFVPPLVSQPMVPKTSAKEQFPQSLGYKKSGLTVTMPCLSHPSLLPTGRMMRFEDAMPSHATPGRPVECKYTHAPLGTQGLPRWAPGHHSGYICCPLIPLAQCLQAWLALNSLSHWVFRTIRLGDAIQFTQCTARFSSVWVTSVADKDVPVLCAEIAVLLAKDKIEPIPPAYMKSGFYKSILRSAQERR